MNSLLAGAATAPGRLLPDMPMVMGMVMLTLVIGLAGGLTADELIATYNAGFGWALGEFALILLPSFCLAAAMTRKRTTAARSVTVGAAPVAGAGMICPDTAYAALSPVAGTARVQVAFGAYAGFKLLYPAGPLIVATGLGVVDSSLPVYGLVLLVPVWIVGLLWAGLWQAGDERSDRLATDRATTRLTKAHLFALSPFVLLATVLIVGMAVDLAHHPVADFLTRPKGALLFAALLALAMVEPRERRGCLDSAVDRTGGLLLVIGAASALGAVLTSLVPLASIASTGSGVAGVVGLFVLAASFKLVQGSSMATFAAVAPIAAPVVAGMNAPAPAAVFALCAGSFVAILPNDSFYWLVRRDALVRESESRTMVILAGGATLQALTALGLIVLAMVTGAIPPG